MHQSVLDGHQFADGVVLRADSTTPELAQLVRSLAGELPLVIADPPYGNIVDEDWDQTDETDDAFAAWMLSWTKLWAQQIALGGALYVWGGVGKVGFRPFLKYLTQAESKGELELANLITWSKKRAYGVQNNYLWTREECAYLVRGDAKKPRVFNVPLLEEKRGYAGYDKEHPAKSEYLRRTNVWTDITEIFKGKVHPTQKQQRLHEVMIEVHTNPGELVVDLFAGSGVTAKAARKLGRKFVVIEKKREYFDLIVKELSENASKCA